MYTDVGYRIRRIREDMNLSKDKFGKLLGVTGQYIGLLERGNSILSISKLERLCKISKKSADYILFGKSIAISTNLSKYSNEEIETSLNVIKDLYNLVNK